MREAAVVGSGHDWLTDIEPLASDVDLVGRIETPNREELVGECLVDLFDDSVGGCHHEHVVTFGVADQRGFDDGVDRRLFVGVAVNTAVMVVCVDGCGIAIAKEE